MNSQNIASELIEKINSMDSTEMQQAAEHIMLGGGTRGGPALAHGEGVRVWDTDGKEYIDCTSQSWALLLGYRHPQILEAVSQHIHNLTHIHQGFDSKPRFYLAQKLAELAPGNLNRVSFTVGGGPAIEAAMKICIKNVPDSRDFVCLHDSYHGTTLGTMGASWISTKATGDYAGGSRFLPLTRPFVRIPNPVTYRNPMKMDTESYIDLCIAMARETFTRGIAGRPAGLIVEPLQASAGQLILPQRYLKAMRDLCDEFGTLLVYDEIQTFARIGKYFAAEAFEVQPDIMVLGKGIGAGFPLAAIVVGDHLKGFQPDAEELHTFAHPTPSMVAAACQLEILGQGVMENAVEMGGLLHKGLKELQSDFPEIGDIRQLGLHIGVELVTPGSDPEPLMKEAGQVRMAAFNHGLILGQGGVRKNVIKIKPPLIVNANECDEILTQFAKAMSEGLETSRKLKNAG